MEYGIGIPGFFGFLASGLPTVKGKDRFSDLQSSLYFYKSMIIIIVLFFLSVLKLHKYRHIDSWMWKRDVCGLSFLHKINESWIEESLRDREGQAEAAWHELFMGQG